MRPGKSPSSTREQLIVAAAAEFGEHGFGGTDTNRIARRAGFAPQTFYRWFKDKTEIFLAVYRAWEEAERETMTDLLRRGAGETEQIEAALADHRDHRVFRRSLRALSLTDDAVRLARAQSRRRQIERIGGSPETAAVLLLQLERLADALAEGELADMGLDDAVARQCLEDLLRQLRSNGKRG
ncbi:MAG TPA: TetR/AcrR family transcriptional regulator [Caulobacter sp.]|nr:TetR/AcrR family transcriptional regulator [Caulobacter sp.]